MHCGGNLDCTLHGNLPVQSFVLGGSSANFLGNLCGISAPADGIIVVGLYLREFGVVK